MSVDAASVSYVLSSMASVGKIMETVRVFLQAGKTPTAAEFDSIEKTAQNEVTERERMGGYKATELAASMSMSKEITDLLRSEMDKIKERLKISLTDPRLDGDGRIRVLFLEQRQYCKHLAMIKDLNGGRLPPDLVEEWEKNRCDSF